MGYYPNPNGGAPIQASSDAEAAAQGWNPGMGTYGVHTTNDGPPPTTGGSSAFNAYDSQPNGGVSGAGGSGGGGGAGGSGSGLQGLLGALASGNAAAAQEAIREFNQTFGLDQQKFAEAVNEYNQNFGLAQAGLTGTYNAPDPNAQLRAKYSNGTFVKDQNGQGIGVMQNGQLHVFPDMQAYQAAGGPMGTGGAADMSKLTAVDTNTFQTLSQPAPSGQGQGTPTLAAILQQANIAAQAAGLTGIYNGAQTLAGQQQQWAQGLANQVERQAEQKQRFDEGLQNQQLGLSALQLQSSLHGDPFRQQQVMYGLSQGGYSNAINAAAGIGGVGNGGLQGSAANTATLPWLASQFTAPGGTPNNAINAGGGAIGGNAIIRQSNGDFTQSGGQYQGGQPGQPSLIGGYNGASPVGAGFGAMLPPGSDGGPLRGQPVSRGSAPGMPAGYTNAINALPNPNQIVARNFNAMDPSTQQFILSGESAKTGLDMPTVNAKIQDTLPKFTSPSFGLASV